MHASQPNAVSILRRACAAHQLQTHLRHIRMDVANVQRGRVERLGRARARGSGGRRAVGWGSRRVGHTCHPSQMRASELAVAACSQCCSACIAQRSCARVVAHAAACPPAPRALRPCCGISTHLLLRLNLFFLLFFFFFLEERKKERMARELRPAAATAAGKERRHLFGQGQRHSKRWFISLRANINYIPSRSPLSAAAC